MTEIARFLAFFAFVAGAIWALITRSLTALIAFLSALIGGRVAARLFRSLHTELDYDSPKPESPLLLAATLAAINYRDSSGVRSNCIRHSTHCVRWDSNATVRKMVVIPRSTQTTVLTLTITGLAADSRFAVVLVHDGADGF
jgi:hypothetical protein